jgi:GH35 family endo-1,4-beta-xylanase
MYETTQERDPSVQMFINEYNVIEECEVNANPATFIAQAADLEAQGFQVSFGCQSHFGNPVQVSVYLCVL